MGMNNLGRIVSIKQQIVEVQFQGHHPKIHSLLELKKELRELGVKGYIIRYPLLREVHT